MINTNDCKHDLLIVKISYQRSYIGRLENCMVTSFSLDAEEERFYSITCARCGYRPFTPSADPREFRVPRFTKAISDFERKVKEIIDSDTLVNELRGGPLDSGSEEEWRG